VLTLSRESVSLANSFTSEGNRKERAGNTLEAIGIGKNFLNRTPAAQQLRERMEKWDYIKLKIFCTTKK
jgi:hypothetical protein